MKSDGLFYIIDNKIYFETEDKKKMIVDKNTAGVDLNDPPDSAAKKRINELKNADFEKKKDIIVTNCKDIYSGKYVKKTLKKIDSSAVDDEGNYDTAAADTNVTLFSSAVIKFLIAVVIIVICIIAVLLIKRRKNADETE